MKLGRNDPCPCGSGKKYKKCCQVKSVKNKNHNFVELTNFDDVLNCVPPKIGHGKNNKEISTEFPDACMLTPYVIARMTEAKRVAELGDSYLLKACQEYLKTGWSIDKVSKMSTDEIITQLRKYGISFSHEGFLKLVQGRNSAWEISEIWFEENDVSCTGKEEEFLGLAACELWKRLYPEHPSVEMLDDLMQEGYELLESGQRRRSCDLWWAVWLVLFERFTPEMTMIQDTASVFSGFQSIYNWCQDFENELINESYDPKYAKMGMSYCQQWITQFIDEEDLLQVNFRRALAEFFSQLERSKEAIDVLHEIVERWPKNIWGFIALADEYGHMFCSSGIVPYDEKKANEWLDEALRNCELEDCDLDMIEDRRKSYKSKKKKMKEKM
ncbi:MAG: hypothetical protein A2161_06030 [Candidatus Schekmanbacteria bacterium RBG_13_48_7]|uniref:Zinc chelation protein SecC n=1 Tax=Candidatus Schekmanbacteria bacterium RBG_13_48_7 TaxID=1817878 RepID=A0A1F7RN01_9BACT|nr:MAG: hypothetical protein A2161_06030 [Candidatus Schekmanbacteria bacterium RBG_13_48_7]